MVAAERPVSIVRLLVGVQSRSRVETFSTMIALVRFFFAVTPYMNFEIRRITELLLAFGAGVRHFARMLSHVNLERSFMTEALRTVFTSEWTSSSVDVCMSPEMKDRTEGSATGLALMYLTRASLRFVGRHRREVGLYQLQIRGFLVGCVQD